MVQKTKIVHFYTCIGGHGQQRGLILDIPVYLVVGGWSSNNHALDSTEVFSGDAWTIVAPLPAAVSGGRGFTFANNFYMAGTNKQFFFVHEIT